MDSINNCPVCGNIDEDVWHAIFTCELSCRAWTLFNPRLGAFISANVGTEDFMWKWLVKVERMNIKGQSLYLAWLLWRNRNEAKHELKCEMAEVLTQKAGDYYQEYATAMVTAAQGVCRPPSSQIQWTKPQMGWIKINVDVGMGQDGIARLGAVARDYRGMVQFSSVRGVSGISDVVLGELLAIYYGMELANDFSLDRIIVETDSLQSIKEIENHESFSPWGSVLRDIMDLKFDFSCCLFKFAARSANMVAHNIAKHHVDVGASLLWWKALPTAVNNDAVTHE